MQEVTDNILQDANKWVDFYFYDKGNNVVPAIGNIKRPIKNWEEWQDKPQPPELIEQWKSEDLFKNGIAIITGKLWRKKDGRHCIYLDYDNQKAYDEIYPDVSKDELACRTLLEEKIGDGFYGHKDSGHVRYETDDTGAAVIQDKHADSKDRVAKENLPAFEIKATGDRIIYVTPTNGYRIQGTNEAEFMDAAKVTEYKTHLQGIIDRYNLRGFGNKSEYSKEEDGGDRKQEQQPKNFVILTQDQIERTHAIFQPYYKEESRNDIILNFAGFAAKVGVAKSCTWMIVKALMKTSGYNDENEKKSRTTVEHTYEKFIKRGAKSIAGYSVLVEIIRTIRDDLDVTKASKVLNDVLDVWGLQNNTEEQSEEERKLDAIGQSQFFSMILQDVLDSIYHFKTLKDTEEILYYSMIDGKYHLGGEQRINVFLEQKFDELNHLEDGVIAVLDAKFRNEIITHVKYKTLVDRKDFDANPHLLHFRNGYYNLKLHVFRKGHTPDYLSRIVIPHDYNPYAQCPKVIKFLYDILPIHRVKIVLKMLGYCFQADCKHQKGFMMFGKGKNGKGVVISLIRAMLGSDNCSTIGLHDICESRFEQWLLDGKLANTYGDLPKRPIKDLSKFKSIVVGEELNAERKYHDAYIFKNKAKLIFSANTIPEMEEKTYGNYRRWVLIEFERAFDAISDNKELTEELTGDENEMSGLINLALTGYRILQKEKGFEDMPMEEIKRQYESDKNDVELFLNEYYTIDLLKSKEYETKADDIKKDYEKYCEKEGIRTEDRSNDWKLTSLLTIKGCVHKQLMRNKKRDYYYVGIIPTNRLKQDQNTLI